MREIRIQTPADIEKAQEVEHLGSWIYHPTDPNPLTCSRELCRIFGLRENEFDGRMESFFTLVHPEDREAVERATVTAIVDNIPYSLEHRIMRPDGSVKWVHAQADIMRDAEGRLVQIIGVIQDITAHREAKERVHRSERRYHTLVHASPVGIFHTDAQGECIYVNERWCELTGLKAEEARGSGWTRALHPGDRERITTEWYAVAKQHRLFNSVYRYLRPDGRIIWVYGQAAGEESETGEIIGYVGTVTDITEQKQIEQRLLQQQGELCHAQRLITIGELAGVMAHELNQPLGAIANYLEGATIRYEKEFKSNPELGKVLKHTLRLAERATHIIRNIRTLVRKRDPNRQRVDINTLIRETVRLIGAEAASSPSPCRRSGSGRRTSRCSWISSCRNTGWRSRNPGCASPPPALGVLGEYEWPGNIRELENVIERAMVLSTGEEIQPEDLAVPTFGVFVPTAGASRYQRQLEGVEKELLLQALKEHRGDKQAAARVLGIALSTLYAKLKKYQL